MPDAKPSPPADLDDRLEAQLTKANDGALPSPTTAVNAGGRASGPSGVGQNLGGDERRGDEIDMRTYLDVLRRRWKVVAVVMLVALAAGLGRSMLQPKMYQASSTLLVQPQQVTVDDTSRSRNSQQVDRDVLNEARLMGSDPVVEAVRKAYDGTLDPGAVKATVRGGGADVITVSMKAKDPKKAAALVNLYVSTFRDYRLTTQVSELLATGTKLQERVDAIDARTREISKPLQEVEAKLVADPENPLLKANRDELEKSLAPQLSTLESQRTFYSQQLDNAQLSAQLAGRGTTSVLAKATTPRHPISPKPARDAAVALALGLLAGLALAFLVESLDERLRTSEDLERVGGGLSILAVIPEFDTRSSATPLLLQGSGRPTPAAEAFRSLRTSIRFASTEMPIHILQVTSPIDAEGKTTTVANLAAAFAQGGHRVVVIDADLRRPRLASMFEKQNAPGLTDVLLGDVKLSEAVVTVTADLDLLPAGSIPPNPSELLSTVRSAAVVSALAESYDLVLIDCSPVLPATDALIVSRLANATILVTNARRSKRGAIRRTLEQLGHVGAPILGLVLNAAPAGGAYGYGYGYTHDSGPRSLGSRRREAAVPTGSDELAVHANPVPLVPAEGGSDRTNG